MTPELSKAEADYKKFVKALDVQNKLAFQSASKGFADLGGLVSQFGKMADNLGKNYARAVKKVQREAKPITQRIDISFTTRSIASLRKQVGEAIGKALSSATIRLSATTPAHRLKMFDTGATLRTLYKETPQPPDMRGKIKVPGYAKGGKIKGDKGSFDSVLAALTPGEVVLPVNLVKALERFDVGMKKQGKLKGLLDAGLGTPNDIKKHAKIMGTLADELSTISSKSKNLSADMRHRIAPGLIDATKRMEELGEATEETNKESTKLMKEGLGAAKFLGVHKALSSVRDAFNSLQSKASSTFTTLGGGEIGKGLDSLNEMNQILGRTRPELSKIKSRVADVAAEIDGVTFDELAYGMKVAAEIGVRNVEQMFDLATASTLAAKGTTMAAKSAQQFGYFYTDALGGTIEGYQDVIGAIANLSQVENVEAQKLLQDTIANTNILTGVFQKLGPARAKAMLDTLNRVGASLESIHADSTGFRESFAQALRGSMKGDLEAIARVQNLTGMGAERLQEALVDGDVEGIFRRVAENLRGMSPAVLATVADTFGVTAKDLTLIVDKQGDFNANLARSQKLIPKAGGGMGILEMRADVARTWFQKIQEGFTDTAGAMSIFGVKGVDVLDFFKEFNIVSLVAVGYLGKVAWGFGAAALKGGAFLLTLLKLRKATVAVAAVSTAATAAGTAATGGGLAGFFTGLAAGLTAFGAAMIGPGGLGLLALVGSVIGIGFAAKLAAPLVKTLVPVLTEMVKGFVSMFKTLTKMKPGDIAKFGLALAPVALGVNLLGVSFGVAAVGMGAFMAVMALGNISGKGVVGVLEGMVGDLGRLGALQGQLMQTAEGLKGAARFLAEFAKVGAILAVLGAVSVIDSLVTSFLGFFAVKSPLAQLADKGTEVADTLLSLAKTFKPLDTVSKDSKQIQGGLMASANMVRDLSPLISETIALGTVAGGLKKGWFSDSPLVKIADQSGPLVDTINTISGDMLRLNVTASARDKTRLARDMLRDMRGIITAVRNLSKEKVDLRALKGRKEALQLSAEMATSLTQTVMHQLVTPEMIEQAISAQIQKRGADDPIVKQMQESNQLLKKMVELLSTGNSDRKENKPEPKAITAARSSIGETASNFTQ